MRRIMGALRRAPGRVQAYLIPNFARRVHLVSGLYGRCRVVIGGSNRGPIGWVMSDKDELDLLSEDDWAANFTPNSIDAMLAEHVWEHLTDIEGREAARRCLHYLRPGGYLRIAVPDGFHPDPDYIDWVKVNGVGLAADDHKVLYDYKSLCGMLRDLGYKPRLLEYFDEDGAFHYTPWRKADGFVLRTSRHDRRNRDGNLNFTSLLVDAYKPA